MSKKDMKTMNRGMRWNVEDTKILLECISEKIKDNSISFEKPVASAFYTSLKEDNSILSQYNWTSMRDKMKNLKLKYKQAIDWRNKTGQGVEETSGMQSLKDYVNKICPFFDKLDGIFGSRSNVNIDVIIDSESNFQDILNETLQSASDNEFIQSNSLEDKLSDDLAVVTNIEETATINKSPTSFVAFKNQLQRSGRKRKINTTTNSTVAYLSKLQQEKTELDKIKFEKESKISEEKLKIDLRKIEFQEKIQSKQIEIEERKALIEEKKIQLEREKMEEEMKIKLKELEDRKMLEILKIEKEMELKKYEIETKLKYRKEL